MEAQILKELQEIKKLLQVIASNPEQNVVNKCIVCGNEAELELESGNFICENCAQTQGELAQF